MGGGTANYWKTHAGTLWITHLGIPALVLLCHKMLGREPFAPQAGQYGSPATSVRACRIRCVAMDAGLCRGGLAGGAPRDETPG